MGVLKKWISRFGVRCNGDEQVDNAARAYVADSDLFDPRYDEFSRHKYAERLANTIKSRTDKSSLVIGIYGAWGEGKSTLLNFIQVELSKTPNITTVRFNPWYFRDEGSLIAGFFHTLSSALKRPLVSPIERLGRLLQKYGNLAALAGITGLDSSVKTVGRLLGSSSSLEQLKTRLNRIIEGSGRKIVVFVDDIDRLDKQEIQTIFKLVKLTASFSNVTYILAFDKEMVAKALEEKYGSGEGERFIEKIVQVPLELPRATEVSLLRYCFQRISQVLNDVGLVLTPDQKNTFTRHFTEGFSIALKTPRMVKRYANQLLFSLPLLKDEVNPVDLLLIEGVRAFYPLLYNAIWEHKNVFLGMIRGHHSSDNLDTKEKAREVIENALCGLPDDEKAAAKDLIANLFPNTKWVLGNDARYGPEWGRKWAKDKRICSVEYFPRYFTYAVTDDDIPDLAIQSFIDRILDLTVEESKERLLEVVTPRNAGSLVLKLRRFADRRNEEICRNLALVLASFGDGFPEVQGLYAYTSPRRDTACFISELVGRIPPGRRAELASEVLKKCETVSWALICFNAMRSQEGTPTQERLLSKEEEKVVCEPLIGAIQNRTDLLDNELGLEMLYLWSAYGDRDDVTAYLHGKIDQDWMNAVKIMSLFLTLTWDAENVKTGLPLPSEVLRKIYDQISYFIDPEIVIDALRKGFGEILDNPRMDFFDEETSLEQRIAEQFAYIHRKISEERQPPVDDNAS